MNKLGSLLHSRWGAFVIWVVVMYLTALLWSVMDDDSWYAFPTYVVSVLAWIAAFLYAAGFFVEWTGTRLRLKQTTGPRPRTEQTTPSDHFESE